MRSTRTATIALAMLIASALPVLDMTPAYAAPPTALGRLAVPDWSTPARAAEAAAGPVWSTSGVVPGGDVVLVGADWGGAHTVQVEVRTRTADAWTPWQALEESHDGPDGSTDEPDNSTVSDPLWTGLVDALQFRTTAPNPHDVRFDVVRIEGGREALERTPVRRGPASTADAATARPTIISRADWGAQEWRRNGDPHYADNVRFAVVHHTAGTNSYEPWESDDIVRSIYAFHTGGDRNWDDIGYNFLIDRYGQIFEGRGGGIEEPVIGAHASGFNSGSVGVAVMGNFQKTSAPQAARTALTQLLAWKLDVHHVDPLGTTDEVAGGGSQFERGTRVTLPAIIGHRDTGETACPGDLLYSFVDSGTLARAVAATGTPKLYSSAPRSVQQPRGDRLTIEATATETVSWKLRVTDDQDRAVRTQLGTTTRTIAAEWDHRDDRGLLVPTGTYSVELSAVGESGTARPVTVTTVLVEGPPVGDPDAEPVNPPAGAILLTGDWDGDGQDSPGWFKDGRWGLHDRSHAQGNTTLLTYGQAGDVPVVGDWDGDGDDTIGIVRGNRWLLRNRYVSGDVALDLEYGQAGDVPVTGDWDGDGDDTIGVVRGNRWILRNRYVSGNTALDLEYGRDGDVPVTGDWDGDGDDTIGVVRGNRWILRNRYVSGNTALDLEYGEEGDLPVTGDWDADATDTIGIIRDGLWVLRNRYHRNAIDYVFEYGPQ